MDAQTKQFNMQTRNMKRKNSDSKQVSRTKKTKLEEVFPIETFLQNPGYQLISRNIYKYLKLKDFSNCCLVSKGWKQFIDEDKSLANVQLTEAMSMYSKRKSIQGFTPFHFACQKGSDLWGHSTNLCLRNCWPPWIWHFYTLRCSSY